MNYKLITTIVLLAVTLATKAQDVLYNNGSILQVNAGCVIQVNGNLTNTAVSTLTNNGTITLTGNITNNQVMATANAGTLEFKGSTAQMLNGAVTYFANNILLNNAAGFTLNTTLKCDGIATFTNGIVTAAPTTTPLIFTTNGSVTGTSDASHVNGYVVKEGTGNFAYPVGNGSKYQPCDVNLSANATGMQVKYNTTDAGVGTFTKNGTEATSLVAYNGLENWNITPQSTATGTVTMYWDAFKNLGIANVNDLKVARKLGTDWLNEGTIGTGNTVAGSVASNSISNWGIFTLGSINATSTLPVKITSYELRITNEKQVTNYWTTSSETNSKNFEVQRSPDGRNFAIIGTVTAKGFASDYSFVDEKPLTGVNYYKLKQVDNDGKFAYSDVRTVNFKPQTLNISIYPNPAINVINIKGLTTNKNNIIIIDIVGKVVLQLNSTTQQSISITNLKAGAYFIKINNENTIKFIKE
ncbi:MAG: T9SS type A sorting domain-containing protein [Deinococcales bacterium]|nr:T9SS type A sorting domain-containing protein [Chitinophagaceae bacterium]